MVTMVGKQEDFADALFALCELDYDAIGAYEAAINRIENESYKQKLTEFKNDHVKHTVEITKLLKSRGKDFPNGGDSTKSLLAKGKVVIAELFGDNGILKAMKTNEDDTNTAYENLNNHKNKWTEAQVMLQLGWEDEKRHREWIEITLNEIEARKD